MSDAAADDRSGRAAPDGTILLLFGLPESGADAVARALHAGGAALAADAGREGDRFAVSAELERVAAELGSALGAAPDAIGPLLLPNASATGSRRRIDRQLEPHLDDARAALTRVLPTGGPAPIVIAAAEMGALPRFWLAALGRLPVRVRPVLIHRNPLVIAQLARVARGRTPRQTVFLWHHLAIEVLSAAPATVEVLTGPDFDLAGLGFPAEVASLPPHPRDDADVAQAPIVSEQSRDLDALLRRWSTLDPQARAEAVTDLRQRFDEAVTLTGAAKIISRTEAGERARPAPPAKPAPPVAAPAPAAAPAEATAPLLFHYHIFKNAGTSVDKMLKANFSDAWAEHEFSETPPSHRHQAIRTYLEAHPELHAFSSHTAPMPAPDLPGRTVFPILFVRHPLLRVRSAYYFEQQQDAQTRGAIVAKSTDFRGYVTTFLDDPKFRHLRNFQSLRFATGTPGRPVDEMRRALETLSRLPFVGLVEAYDRSAERLGELLKPLFPNFRAITLHENATSGKGERSIEERLAALRDELGPALYARLAAENANDLELFERVSRTYA